MDCMIDYLCAMNIHYRFFPIEYFFSSVSHIGFKNVEIWLCPQHFEVTYNGYESSEKLKRLAKENHVNIACLCAEQNNPKPSNMAARDKLIIDHSLKYFKNVIDLANELNVSKVLFTSGWSYYDETISNALNRSINHMQELCDYALNKNVTICIEPLQPFESRLVNNKETMKNYLNNINKDNVKIALDLGALGKANESIDEWFLEFGDRIVHCHYVDGNPTGHLPIGKGNRNIEADMISFLKNDYKGFLSFEFANSIAFENPKQADLDSIKVIENSLNQIRKGER